MSLGNLDTPADWNATARLKRAGIDEVPTTTSDAFMLGFKLGFINGYQYGQWDRPKGIWDSRAAYDRDASLYDDV